MHANRKLNEILRLYVKDFVVELSLTNINRKQRTVHFVFPCYLCFFSDSHHKKHPHKSYKQQQYGQCV